MALSGQLEVEPIIDFNNHRGLVMAIRVGADAFVFGGVMLIPGFKLRSWAGVLTTGAAH